MMSLAYLKFWIKSSNEHGIHSPFVFNFVTRGLYNKDKRWQGIDKRSVFIERVLDYFKPKRILWFSNKEESKFSKIIDAEFFKTDYCDDACLNSIDLIYIDETYILDFNQLENILQIIPNDSFVLVDKSRASEELINIWEQLIKSKETTVTLDFYYFGLAFIRREQLKQNFLIRL